MNIFFYLKSLGYCLTAQQSYKNMTVFIMCHILNILYIKQSILPYISSLLRSTVPQLSHISNKIFWDQVTTYSAKHIWANFV